MQRHEKVGVKEKSERISCCKILCCFCILAILGGGAYVIFTVLDFGSADKTPRDPTNIISTAPNMPDPTTETSGN